MSQRHLTEDRVGVVIVGTGFAGLGMGIQLKKAGFDDFVILEKADEVGGTWRDNTYPGCACDIQSHLYSYSFELNPDWSRMFSEQGEIWDYLKHCTEKYGLRRHVRFGTKVLGAEYDGDTGTWRVSTNRGEITARATVLGLGSLHLPSYPDIVGLDRFKGKTFHSVEWDHDYDMTGKRVAVIGTGASAIQFVPRIAGRVAKLCLFQRTPPWIMPKPDRPVSTFEKRLFHALPFTQRAYRTLIYWLMESRVLGFTVNTGIMKLGQLVAKRHLRKQINDPRLREVLTPSYTMGCKRVLLSNDFYPTLNRSNVDLITDGITELREHGIVTAKGEEIEVDAIIYGTGFRVVDAFDDLLLVGRNGLKLRDAWHEGPEGYLGVAISGFPNLFLFVGPNSGLGHNSMIFMIEAQVRYVMQALRLLFAEKMTSVEVRASVQQQFNRKIQSQLGRDVWSTGCRSWYLDGKGVNRALWPGFTFDYWRRTRKLDLADYKLEAL